ncbi:CDP-alcohol phosphatidyltransferase family protein [Enterococcus sp. LJL128]|uniref:CDP-alcohol phosphatidyltransferase family protein n=1 Tax=Enterococcus sp. LJL51 TaxID=3416656 RepID=UPI003CEBF3F5
MIVIQYAANILTSLRFFLTFFILFTNPFSVSFFILYAACGISDMLDGYVARATNTATSTGALLDSLADIFFLVIVCFKVIPAVTLPPYFLYWGILIIIIRMSAYLVGFKKYRKFSSLHTWLNKLSGLLLFCAPLLYLTLGIEKVGLLLIGVTFISALEELLLTIRSESLDRNQKGLFF